MSPEAYNAEILRTLKEQSDKLSKIEGMLTVIVGLMRGEKSAGAAPAARGGPGARTDGGGKVAPDSDLDGRFGDPEIRKDPRDWEGESYKGFRFSQAPPDYLDMLASFLDWKASKEDDEGKAKYAGYSRADAARARGWAKRIRGGWSPSSGGNGGGAGASGPGGGDDDYGF